MFFFGVVVDCVEIIVGEEVLIEIEIELGNYFEEIVVSVDGCDLFEFVILVIFFSGSDFLF